MVKPIVNCPLAILLYGCNVAAGDAGEKFITKLNQITGAEIAASTTAIGNSNKEGNWLLDYPISSLVTKKSLAFTSETQQNYAEVFNEEEISFLSNEQTLLAKEQELVPLESVTQQKELLRELQRNNNSIIKTNHNKYQQTIYLIQVNAESNFLSLSFQI